MQKLRSWAAAFQRFQWREQLRRLDQLQRREQLRLLHWVQRRQSLAVAGVAMLCIALTVLAALVESGGAVQAQSGPPPAHARYGHKMLLPGSIPPALHKAKRVGPQDAGTKLQLTISLQVSDPDGLAALIASQNDPKSSQYHKYLTPQDFISRFSPSQQSVAAVKQFLTSAGLKVTSVSDNRTLVDATGTLAQGERAFGVNISHYQLGKRDVYGPDAPPQIPDTLAATVIGVGGLDNVAMAHPLLSAAPPAMLGPRAQQQPGHAQHPAAGPAGGFTPSDLRGAYDVSSLISAGGDGTSQRIAVFELAPYIAGDISSYRSNYSLPSSTINPISVDGATTTCTSGASCDNGSGISEADLDLEVVSALAPNATQDVYVGPNNGSGLTDTYNKIVSTDQDRIMTTSWGLCEPDSGNSMLQSLDQIFAQGASQGQSFFAAAGDEGSDDCATYSSSGTTPSGLPPSIDSPGDDPYVLGVGGTSLTLSGSSYGSETVWNNGPDTGAGGGGLSSYFSQPSYQVGLGVLNTYSTGEREAPDVTADADPYTGYSVYCSSSAECGGTSNPWDVFGGTSAATPLWAAVMTDTDTYLANHSVTLPGWLNPTLYTLFSNTQTYTPYHDVTSGNNDIDYSGTSHAGDYPATTCYDLASGVGSPDVWNLARDIQGGVQTSGNGACANPESGTQLIQDGGFEQPANSSPWTQFSLQGHTVIESSGQAHSGAASFLPCGSPTCDDRVAQSVSIPATVNHAHLWFWLETFSDFPTYYASPPCLDHIYATLSTPDGTPITNGSLVASCPTSASNGYQLEFFDVSSLLQAHTGQSLVLTFRGTTGAEAPTGSYYTGWSIDDASLIVS